MNQLKILRSIFVVI